MHQALEMLRRLAGVLDSPVRQMIEPLPGFSGQPDRLLALLSQQFGVLWGDTSQAPGLLARLVLEGEAESMGVLLQVIAGLAHMPAAAPGNAPTLGRYTLIRKVPCGEPDECWIATLGEEHARDQFVRTFARERLTDELIDRLKRWMLLPVEGAAQLFDFGMVEHRPYLASEQVHGSDLRRLKQRRPSLPIALALLWEGMSALEAIHEKGETHGHLSEGRVRIQPLGAVRLCVGASELPERENMGRDLCTLARLMLSTAIDDPLLSVLESDDPEALVVAGDRLEELFPALDEMIAAVLWKRDPDPLPLLRKHIAREEALRMIGAVVEDARG